MFLRFIFFLSFASTFAQVSVPLCEEKWDNGMSKCGPSFYSGADLLSDNIYVARRFDVARTDSLVYDLGSVNYQDLDSLVMEMDFNAIANSLNPYFDTLSNGFELDQEIGSYLQYNGTYTGQTSVACRWVVRFNGKMELVKKGRLKITLPANGLSKQNTIMYYSLFRSHGLMNFYDGVKVRTKFLTCLNGQTERQLYNCMCDNTPDPANCKLAYFTPSAPYSFNVTIDNFIAIGYKSGIITSIDQQNEGIISTKNVVAKYDLIGRQIEDNTSYSGFVLCVFSDGSRRKIYIE